MARCVVRRFPFAIFYTVSADEIEVVAIFILVAIPEDGNRESAQRTNDNSPPTHRWRSRHVLNLQSVKSRCVGIGISPRTTAHDSYEVVLTFLNTSLQRGGTSHSKLTEPFQRFPSQSR